MLLLQRGGKFFFDTDENDKFVLIIYKMRKEKTLKHFLNISCEMSSHVKN